MAAIRRRDFLAVLVVGPFAAAGALYASRISGAGDKDAPAAIAPPTAVPPSYPVISTGRPVGTDAAASERGPFFVYMEVLTADRPSVYGYMAPRGCMPSGEFKRGERIVFRFEVTDTSTGGVLTSKDGSVKVKLPYGYDGAADYKQRGEGRVPDAPWTWDFCWDVPLDYPLGTLAYRLEISTRDGRAATWQPPALVDPSRGIDTRPQIIA